MTPDVGARETLQKWALQVSRFAGTRAETPTPDDYASPERVAQRFRAVCAEHGPFEVATAVGYTSPHPGGFLTAADLRYITYLLAHAVAPDDAVDDCITQGVHGFVEFYEATHG